VASTSTRWRSGWRQGAALLDHLADEPRAELLAMIWGPVFDREQAHALLLRWPRVSTTAFQVVAQAAARFDTLTPRQQERLRRRVRLALEPAHRVGDNSACTASC
jgi:hypothetical protein